MPRRSPSTPPPHTKLYHHHHPQIGHVTGLTYTSPANSSTELCHYFGGLPYALPPIGAHRWRLPRPLPKGYRFGTKSNPGHFTGGCAQCAQPALNAASDDTYWDEDCLQLNIWIPAGEAPKGGWPVLFWIHGGFLQFGTPNGVTPVALLSQTSCRAIIVTPAYRLNLFGFLASRELVSEPSPTSSSTASNSNTVSNSNFGFHDQRLALEWTANHIAAFNGNPAQLTLAGHSAGAHSAFHQLSHDLYLPESQRLIHRVLLLSNGAGMQPKTIQELQPQFEALLTRLSIPLHLSNAEKLERLRSIPAKLLLEAAEHLDLHEFRACTDLSNRSFVNKHLFSDIDSGVYAQRLLASGVEVIVGEVADEHFVYATWRSPKQNTLQAVRERLYADYHIGAVDTLLDRVYCPDGRLPDLQHFGGQRGTKCKDWKEVFGRIYADLQVHALERGWIDSLVRHGAGERVRRYRIEWRAECVGRAGVPKEWGVTHGTDVSGIWYFGGGVGGGLKREEEDVVQGFAEPVWQWICGRGWGEREDWAGSSDVGVVRLLSKDGETGVWRDEMWQQGLRVWDVGRKAVREEHKKEAKL